MTATETITSNPRVLGADPLVEYDEANHIPGGIGEEDIVYIVLPYIHSAREGVERLGSLLEKYGTYEMNGIAFQDHDEIWWLETIGGHHWIAKKVPDDHYVAMPNQFGIDNFDLEDALTSKKNHMCSSDMKEFIEKYHLNLSLNSKFNARDTFGVMMILIIFTIHHVLMILKDILIHIHLIINHLMMIFHGHKYQKRKLQ